MKNPEGNHMKPIRRTQKLEKVGIAWSDEERPVSHEDIAHILSNEGSPDSVEVTIRNALDCGCLKPPAGCCSSCGGIACENCYGFCKACKRPLCPAHSFFVEGETGGEIRLCASCHEVGGHNNVLGKLGRALFRPFIDMDD